MFELVLEHRPGSTAGDVNGAERQQPLQTRAGGSKRQQVSRALHIGLTRRVERRVEAGQSGAMNDRRDSRPYRCGCVRVQSETFILANVSRQDLHAWWNAEMLAAGE